MSALLVSREAGKRLCISWRVRQKKLYASRAEEFPAVHCLMNGIRGTLSFHCALQAAQADASCCCTETQ